MTIEIGTSDFRTQAGKVEGIFIEPVKYYFDRLPECNKENVAISNYEGSTDVFFLTDDQINSAGFPDWVRGCNSINHPHPTVLRLMREVGLSPMLLQPERVKVVRIKSIIDKYNVTHIDFLKIDTEGHDCIILNDFLDTVDILPKVIQFEANVLSNQSEVEALSTRLSHYNYRIQKVNDDIIATL